MRQKLTNMKRYYYSIIVALLICQLGFGQNKEYLILNSDTLRLIIDEQVDSFGGFAHQTPIGLDDLETDQINCWEIKNDSLFEVRLFNTEESFRIFQHNMNRILYRPDGILLRDFGLTQIYTHEIEFRIKNGIVVETKLYDNSSSILSPYSNMSNIFYDYLRTKIDFRKLDTLNCKKVFFVIKSLSEDFLFQDIEILRGCDEQTNQELIQAIKTLPQWSIIYLHGRKTNYYNLIIIDLNKI